MNNSQYILIRRKHHNNDCVVEKSGFISQGLKLDKSKCPDTKPLKRTIGQPLQSTIPPSSKNHTTFFKVPHEPLHSTTQPTSKYHNTLLKILNIYQI